MGRLDHGIAALGKMTRAAIFVKLEIRGFRTVAAQRT